MNVLQKGREGTVLYGDAFRPNHLCCTSGQTTCVAATSFVFHDGKLEHLFILIVTAADQLGCIVASLYRLLFELKDGENYEGQGYGGVCFNGCSNDTVLWGWFCVGVLPGVCCAVMLLML